MSNPATARTVAGHRAAAPNAAAGAITDVLSELHGWDWHDGQCRCGWRVTATVSHPEHQAEAMLDALDEAGWELKRKPEDRWGFYLRERPGHVYERYGEDSARRGVSVNPEGRVMVRWPHGGAGWVVVPDAP